MRIDLKEVLLKDLKNYKNKVFANYNASYLQTHVGGYGEGDFFWGVRVLQQRIIAEKYWENIALSDVEILLRHKVHEVRSTALVILVKKYENLDDYVKSNVIKIYLYNSKYVNNWDLVDLSAARIPGHYWYNNSLKEFWKYAKSKNLWKKRIAMVSMLYFIRHGRFEETFKLVKLFLNCQHDLIYKASGWMLREIGKTNEKSLILFLNDYSKIMPRIMLRYSIEKLPEESRRCYMNMQKYY
jgi:3-methyladenine DNA glycosylase AlkD